MAQSPDEKTYVEIPFIEQLKGMGWNHIEGDIDVPYLTERESFRDVLLTGRLRNAIKKISLDDGGEPWLDDDRVNEVVSRLERITAPKLLEANKEAFDLIVQGIEVAGDPDKHDGREKTVAVIDFDHPEKNDFLAINQFRVDVPGGNFFEFYGELFRALSKNVDLIDLSGKMTKFKDIILREGRLVYDKTSN